MRVSLDVVLPDALSVELESAAQACHMSVPEWIADVAHAELAARRLPRVFVPELTQGARTCGTSRGIRQHEGFEDAAEAGLVTHKILI